MYQVKLVLYVEQILFNSLETALLQTPSKASVSGRDPPVVFNPWLHT